MTESDWPWIPLLLATAGAGILLAAMIGFWRMPDVYCRSHALSVGATLGFTLVIAALWSHLGAETAGLKLLAAIAFQLLTLPVSSHLLLLQARRNAAPEFRSPAASSAPPRD